MAIEYETKILDIDQKEIENKLKQLGAEYKGDVLLKRWIFKMESPSREWIRLRDEGDKITLTYKKRGSSEIGNTEEIEVEVSDFDETAKLLSKLDWKEKFYQENRKITYVLNGMSFEINIRPMIPVFMEIESTNVENVNKGLELLGMKGKEFGDVGHVELYDHYGIDLHSYKELKF